MFIFNKYYMKLTKKEYLSKLLSMIEWDYVIEWFQALVNADKVNDAILDSIIWIFENYSKKIKDANGKKIIDESINELKHLASKEKISIEKDKEDLDKLENILNNL